MIALSKLGLAAMAAVVAIGMGTPSAEARNGRNGAVAAGLVAGVVAGAVLSQAARADDYDDGYRAVPVYDDGYGGYERPRYRPKRYYRERPRYYQRPRYYEDRPYRPKRYYQAPRYQAPGYDGDY